jgi:hypothetical protein
MVMKTKEELLKIALSGSGRLNKTYKEALGFDDAEKFADAFDLTYGQGRHIPVRVFYYFYYKWVKETSNQKPQNFSVFRLTMGKHTKSFHYSYTRKKLHYRTYKVTNFPKFTQEDFEAARKLVSEQKERIRKKKAKKREPNKEVL